MSNLRYQPTSFMAVLLIATLQMLDSVQAATPALLNIAPFSDAHVDRFSTLHRRLTLTQEQQDKVDNRHANVPEAIAVYIVTSGICDSKINFLRNSRWGNSVNINANSKSFKVGGSNVGGSCFVPLSAINDNNQSVMDVECGANVVDTSVTNWGDGSQVWECHSSGIVEITGAGVTGTCWVSHTKKASLLVEDIIPKCVAAASACAEIPCTDPPTMSPSDSPTVRPSNAPTTSPTLSPSNHPTVSPSNDPTASPSRDPTVSPSNDPTVSPSNDPTTSPTLSPSNDPTVSPSNDPTVSPTVSPSNDPTVSPSNDPTASPTVSPSNNPTVSPSNDPTVSPSNDPTVSPSNDPTTSPSNDPTVSPTVSPSSDPTVSPSNDPTVSPSNDPTVSPSNNPTVSPSNNPTVSPSNDPTISPSNNPTVSPSNTPTVSPSNDPTVSPSNNPTVSPSNDPTVSPSNDPTVSPSNDPTVSPSNDPTVSPSNDPTVSPSNDPTVSPSNDPTLSPSNNPTTSPSNAPTAPPSRSPTFVPTSDPTTPPSNRPSPFPGNPTLNPTTSTPTLTPTNDPTSSPSIPPTFAPTDSPSQMPTASPSTPPTDMPTSTPSTPPTDMPTSTPSTPPTDMPTSTPSTPPTHNPTSTPSALPTHKPTSTPSAPPTHKPTAEPSFVPSARPAIDPLASAVTVTLPPSQTPTTTPLYNLIVSEIFPFDDPNLTGDWFEITNTGTGPWSASVHPKLYYEDRINANAPETPVEIMGITSIQAGESVIVVIGDSSTVTTFTDVWGPVLGIAIPQVGYADGNSLKDGTGGDAVNIFLGGTTLSDLYVGATYPKPEDGNIGRSWNVLTKQWSEPGVDGAVSTTLVGSNGVSAVASVGTATDASPPSPPSNEATTSTPSTSPTSSPSESPFGTTETPTSTPSSGPTLRPNSSAVVVGLQSSQTIFTVTLNNPSNEVMSETVTESTENSFCLTVFEEVPSSTRCKVETLGQSVAARRRLDQDDSSSGGELVVTYQMCLEYLVQGVGIDSTFDSCGGGLARTAAPAASPEGVADSPEDSSKDGGEGFAAAVFPGEDSPNVVENAEVGIASKTTVSAAEVISDMFSSTEKRDEFVTNLKEDDNPEVAEFFQEAEVVGEADFPPAPEPTSAPTSTPFSTKGGDDDGDGDEEEAEVDEPEAVDPFPVSECIDAKRKVRIYRKKDPISFRGCSWLVKQKKLTIRWFCRNGQADNDGRVADICKRTCRGCSKKNPTCVDDDQGEFFMYEDRKVLCNYFTRYTKRIDIRREKHCLRGSQARKHCRKSCGSCRNETA